MEEEHTLTAKILAYIAGRGADKIDALEKSIAKLGASASDADQKKLEALQQDLRDTKEKFEPRNWLTDAAIRAKQLQFVTHAVKYLHGDAKGSNIYDQQSAAPIDGIVSTQSINNPVLDICGNAAALDVGKLLAQIEHEGKTLIDYVLAGDIEPLLLIAQNEQQAREWLTGFAQVFENKELASHKLAKQVYWPLAYGDNEEGEYHLLSPLFASSLAHEVFATRRTQRERQYSKEADIKADVAENGYQFIPNFAVQTFGGTKPQNISQLNSQRGGKNYLLDNRPPIWQQQDKPPLNIQSVFDSLLPSKVYRKAKAAHRLKRYLEKVFNKESTFDIREARARGMDEIVDIFLLFAASIHNHPAGWSMSEDCHLPLNEQLWLDPGRVQIDDTFREAMDKKDWQEDIASKFASWLNRTLQSSTLHLGDVEHREWKSLVAQELRLTERARKEFYS
ncbi:type I-F CRISPR-associated protein Csy1 [Teredinibacter sp. KSP-S5-2]|uniref:type I-F CRISPR-associated protein Csy1 n=1 Tax=Teredinibacter sp. KSP-S5-2 TaxID=3034506 RepID=UPI002934D656|nr:type I-F CRISPR-associated protein Csy1 [Teredinibacter sp. KSP-S5-2]WNO08318.1 type I-F CRISPR-associated protein Csy1 [Teredinibacter sp. KSP-S5-2]